MLSRSTEAGVHIRVCLSISSKLILLLSTQYQREKDKIWVQRLRVTQEIKRRIKGKCTGCGREKNLPYLGEKQYPCNWDKCKERRPFVSSLFLSTTDLQAHTANPCYFSDFTMKILKPWSLYLSWLAITCQLCKLTNNWAYLTKLIKFFYLSADAQENCFKKNIKIYIQTAPTCFGATTIIRGRIIWAC
jgi:hypothetical protein